MSKSIEEVSQDFYLRLKEIEEKFFQGFPTGIDHMEMQMKYFEIKKGLDSDKKPNPVIITSPFDKTIEINGYQCKLSCTFEVIVESNLEL